MDRLDKLETIIVGLKGEDEPREADPVINKNSKIIRLDDFR